MKPIYFVLTLIVLSIHSTLSFAQDNENKQLQNSYITFLKEEGFMPSIDSDGDVKFKFEGKTYYLSPTTDNKMFQIFRTLSDDGNNTIKLLKTANVTMKNNAFVTICVFDNDNSSSILFLLYQYLPKSEDFKSVFYRSMNSVKNSVDYFLEIYNEDVAQVSDNKSTSTSLLPIWGIDFNTTEAQLNRMGYKEKKESTVKSLYDYTYRFENVWVHTKDGKVVEIIIDSYMKLPSNLQAMGLDEKMSYNQWVKKLSSLGYNITRQYDQPTVKYNGESCKDHFTATFSSQNPTTGYKIYCSFDQCGVFGVDALLRERPYMSIEKINK